MANRNTQGFGLVAAGTLGSTPATSGQGKYKIDAGYATTIFHGGAVASSAGFSGEQLANLTKVAKGASLALGRDMGDALDRLVRGTAKLEPEILDELDIIS